MPNEANTYCTIDDVRDLLSASGVSLASDDNPPSDYGNALEKAGAKIDWYCYKRYEPAQLANSPLVRDWAAVLAAWFLRTRRGNAPPQGLAILYQQAIQDLEEVKKGQAEIPTLAVRRSYVPVLIVKRSTQRPYNRGVVERSRGTSATGGPRGYQQKNNDPYDTYGWNTQAFLDLSF